LLKASLLRIGVVVCAIAGLLALSGLPPEHLHVSSSGRALAHRHVIDHAISSRDAVDHGGPSAADRGDHRGVTILEPKFVPERQQHVERYLIKVDFVLIAPEPRPVNGVEPIDALEAHGPPIRTESLRAPPA
jgi:hypothetical protein